MYFKIGMSLTTTLSSKVLQLASYFNIAEYYGTFGIY